MEFIKTNSGELTCEHNKIKLHSAYNPKKEAETFVKNIQVEYTPPAILITGPCFSYCNEFLKKRFPNAKLYAVQFSKDFTEQDKLWDKTFYYNKNDNLSEKIFKEIGDETLISTLFLSWIPSQKAFPEEYEKTWNELKSALLKSRNILNTRSYFSKRWIKNSIRFCLLSNNNAYIKRGNCDILLCASGPSLFSSIENIKKYRNDFFLVCVSSALSPLMANGITPDLCLSTDGGFWAKLHLQRPLLSNTNIPLAIPAEGAANASSLFSNPIISLNYLDGPSAELLNACNFSSMNAQRNGTVSGTAANFALSITDGNVFFLGLDLCENKDFNHTQPNQLEIRDSIKDSRFSPKETRIYPQSLKNQALEIYKNWFSNNDFKGRLFRLSKDYSYHNKLTNVPDVNWNFLIKNMNRKGSKKPYFEKYTNNLDFTNRQNKIYSCIEKEINNPLWKNEIFPVDSVMERRYEGSDKQEEYKNKLSEQMKNFKEEIRNYIYK